MQAEHFIKRCVCERIEKFQCSNAFTAFAFDQCDLARERDVIAFPQETRQVRHHHQRLLRDGLPCELRELQILGVREAEHFPSRERIRRFETEHDAAIVVGEQVGKEEGGFAEVASRFVPSISKRR